MAKGANVMEMGCTKRDRRGWAPLVRPLLVGAVAWMLASAAPAWAARVVDVRVGQHAGYSRVVFELDSPVGYKVERNSTASGGSELVVSLSAAAKAQTVRGKLDFIETVQIVPRSGNRSTVRVRLKGEDLKLKEMILANPPRIVLDVLNEAAIASAKAKSKKQAQRQAQRQAQKKKAQAAKAKAQAAPPKPRAEAKKPEPAPQKPVEIAKAEIAEPHRMVTPQPPASLPPNAGNRPAVLPEPARVAKPPATPPAVIPAAPKPTAANVPPPGVPPATPASPTASARPAPKPAATARPAATPPKPAAMTPPTEDGGLFSLTNIGVGAAGLLLLVGAGVVFMRRRGAAEVVDGSAFDNPLDDDDNPFAGLESTAGAALGDEVEAQTEEIPISQAAQAEVGIPIPDEGTQIIDGTAADAVQGGNEMDMASENAQTTIMNGPPAGTMAGGGDVANMVAEFERRMAAMETRIDELVDAKERLERQVAAQTEELRVQRAAIARTQRAVRNLSRPGEDAPTEPALRDPSRPEGPREE